MNPMKKVMIFSALIMAPIVIAVVIWLVPTVIHAQQFAAFSKVQDEKHALTTTEVEKLMGRPASIEQSQSADQTITGSVYHYPIPEGDMKVTFINGTVFKAEFVSGAKS